MCFRFRWLTDHHGRVGRRRDLSEKSRLRRSGCIIVRRSDGGVRGVDSATTAFIHRIGRNCFSSIFVNMGAEKSGINYEGVSVVG